MIEVTDEMVAAFRDATLCKCHPEDELGTRLAAVLAIVERDWNMQPRPDGMAHLYACCDAAPTEPHRGYCPLRVG